MGAAKALLVGLGSILAIAGTAVAVTIGPDDWLDSASTVVNGDGQTAVTTQYGLVSLSTPVRVRASSDSGEVFIGAGHVIDVEDYLGDAPRVTITGFNLLSLSRTVNKAADDSLPAKPSSLDFWRQQASGGGTQEVSGSYGGQPVVFLISTPDGQAAAITVSMGIKTPAGFAIGLGTALLGLALIALGVFVGRRRRPDTSGAVGAPSNTTAPPPPPPPPFVAPPAPPAPPSGGSVAMRLALLATLCAVLVSATACSGTPLPNPLSAPPPNRADVTINPGTDLDLRAIADDYDRRNNAAIKASKNPTYSTKEWASADTEPYLGSTVSPPPGFGQKKAPGMLPTTYALAMWMRPSTLRPRHTRSRYSPSDRLLAATCPIGFRPPPTGCTHVPTVGRRGCSTILPTSRAPCRRK